jgi:hypothetical protein
MKTIELEVLTTAIEIEMDENDFVLIFSEDEDSDYRAVVWWDNESKVLECPFTSNRFVCRGKMIGWAKIPFYYPW